MSPIRPHTPGRATGVTRATRRTTPPPATGRRARTAPGARAPTHSHPGQRAGVGPARTTTDPQPGDGPTPPRARPAPATDPHPGDGGRGRGGADVPDTKA
ncbi:hypothetical protein GCM10023079_04400 [Streptomyces chitinivorans]